MWSNSFQVRWPIDPRSMLRCLHVHLWSHLWSHLWLHTYLIHVRMKPNPHVKTTSLFTEWTWTHKCLSCTLFHTLTCSFSESSSLHSEFNLIKKTFIFHQWGKDKSGRKCDHLVADSTSIAESTTVDGRLPAQVWAAPVLQLHSGDTVRIIRTAQHKNNFTGMRCRCASNISAVQSLHINTCSAEGWYEATAEFVALKHWNKPVMDDSTVLPTCVRSAWLITVPVISSSSLLLCIFSLSVSSSSPCCRGCSLAPCPAEGALPPHSCHLQRCWQGHSAPRAGGSHAWPCTWMTWEPEGQKGGKLIVVSRLEKEMEDWSPYCTARNFSPHCLDCFSLKFANSTFLGVKRWNLIIASEFFQLVFQDCWVFRLNLTVFPQNSEF